MIRAFVDSARRETAFLRGSVWDLALVTWLPLLLLAIVAVQLSAGVMRNLPIVVVDEDGGGVARDLIHLMVGLNQMGASLAEQTREVLNLAILILVYGGLAWWRFTKISAPDLQPLKPD